MKSLNTKTDSKSNGKASKDALIFKPHAGKALSKAQLEFNRLMKRLDSERAKHEQEKKWLDQFLEQIHLAVMPLIEELNRLNRDLVFAVADIMPKVKLTARRKEWLRDLMSTKAAKLLSDPIGLSDEDLDRLQDLEDELGISLVESKKKQDMADEFEMVRSILEEQARQAGINMDLSDLNLEGDPQEFERILTERFDSMVDDLNEKESKTRKRKPSKKEQRQQEIEEAKKRDIKLLFKQLAKALHPDLEPDPTLKAHREEWMKRLTAANDNQDLREMLQIEMEWLGEESGNLSSASDEKLKVYSMVLKEQISDLKERTESLFYDPQYQSLRRFESIYFNGFSPAFIKIDLAKEVSRHQQLLAGLLDEAQQRQLLIDWAEKHAQNIRRAGLGGC